MSSAEHRDNVRRDSAPASGADAQLRDTDAMATRATEGARESEPRSYSITIDGAVVVETLAAICAEAERISALPLSAEAAQRLIEIIEPARDLGQLALDLDRGAAGAAHDRIALKPSERLLGLLAALRAFDGDSDLVLERVMRGHGQAVRRVAALLYSTTRFTPYTAVERARAVVVLARDLGASGDEQFWRVMSLLERALRTQAVPRRQLGASGREAMWLASQAIERIERVFAENEGNAAGAAQQGAPWSSTTNT